MKGLAEKRGTVVLIGDPQQLDQPTQGSHPDGTGVSALDHILAGEQTIPLDKGLFLEQTWRLHPAICTYTSELFYDSKLTSRDGLDKQIIKAAGPISGAGLRYLPVQHNGNQTLLLKKRTRSERLLPAFSPARQLGSIERERKDQ